MANQLATKILSPPVLTTDFGNQNSLSDAERPPNESAITAIFTAFSDSWTILEEAGIDTKLKLVAILF